MKTRLLVILSALLVCINLSIIVVDVPAYSVTKNSGGIIYFNFYAKSTGKKLSVDYRYVCIGRVSNILKNTFINE